MIFKYSWSETFKDGTILESFLNSVSFDNMPEELVAALDEFDDDGIKPEDASDDYESD